MNTVIKVGLFCYCLFTTALAQQKMQPSKIRFQNLQVAKDYTFYWRSDKGNFTHILLTDTSFTIPADAAKPDGGYFWGINSVTKKTTNTIEFRNNFAPDKLIILNAIINDSILYIQHDIVNENTIGSSNDDHLPKEKIFICEGRSNNTGWFLIGGIMLLVVAVSFYYRYKKKR